MEDKDSKNKKNLENWKIVNFDFAKHTFRGSDKNFLRKITIRKIWKREFTNTL